jgi:capsule polysaccharide export protein KpsC/LpsZ
MIFPSNSKYEYSYDKPFFEMISRFQQELRSKNTLLLSIGFSFFDKHIKAMILEAIDNNPSITLFVITPDVSDYKKYDELKEKSKIMKNIVLINETFENFAKYYPHSDVYDYSNGATSDESI